MKRILTTTGGGPISARMRPANRVQIARERQPRTHETHERRSSRHRVQVRLEQLRAGREAPRTRFPHVDELELAAGTLIWETERCGCRKPGAPDGPGSGTVWGPAFIVVVQDADFTTTQPSPPPLGDIPSSGSLRPDKRGFRTRGIRLRRKFAFWSGIRLNAFLRPSGDLGAMRMGGMRWDGAGCTSDLSGFVSRTCLAVPAWLLVVVALFAATAASVGALDVPTVTSAAAARMGTDAARGRPTGLVSERSHSLVAHASSSSLSILVVGDSYSAGNGAGAYYGAAGCRRSYKNYAEDFRTLVQAAPYRQPATVVNAACSGATTSWFFHKKSGRPPEINAVNHSYNVIFLTIGGNDIHFSNIVQYCLIAKTRDGANCGPNLTRAQRLIDNGTLKKRVTHVLTAIRAAASPSAKIVLLGYPFLESNLSYTLRSGHGGHTFIPVGKSLRNLQTTGNTLQQQIIQQLDAPRQTGQFVFVSTEKLFAGTQPGFTGHDHELSATSNNKHRWFVQPFVDTGLVSSDTWYHPNPTGWDEEAKLLLADASVPKRTPGTGSVSITNPGNQTGAVGTPVSLQMQASDTDGGSLTFDATNLPAGLSISPSSGLISGTPTVAGDSTVTVTAADVTGPVGLDRFGWTIASGTTGASTPRSVSGGYSVRCALLVGGGVDCWGTNQVGELGNGTMSATGVTFTPSPVAGITNAVAVAVGGGNGGGDHVCAVLATGGIDCWGSNYSGELGTGSATGPDICINNQVQDPCSTTPVPVPGITNAVAVGADLGTTCAVLASGTVECWGNSGDGALGDGVINVSNSLTPTAVSGINNAVQISMAEGTFAGTACALLSTGTVECWGAGESGQLGNGWFGQDQCAQGIACNLEPWPVSNLTNATQVSVGPVSACATLVTGGVDCWGDNSEGAIGDGAVGPTNPCLSDNSCVFRPVPVVGITNATGVTVGARHACASLTTGAVDCWGENLVGQLGNGTTTGAYPCTAAPCTPTPVAALGIGTATALGSDWLDSCAVLSGGGIDCWGNSYGDVPIAVYP
jgi:lysophospholipase L1-like esterase